ncbi:ATP-binding protein [Paenibacillus alginolyticus]|uniref:ATP-binding protein n=1 Tax=Paenibacillus alginolyticus TaxID=59839 RepID=A0ABT4G9T0_9BACL|nr:ATP-binding protein [Paenibacillus alginolyticus]MCY9669895.1 ATP-binding protein [Paenibacillus alginolyticus]MCY9692939.1 ATP-binding protein [Paenibacillus alginolyticus]MEC0144320.1 ATP-binding protein [Paenibacillus alginolyticus]
MKSFFSRSPKGAEVSSSPALPVPSSVDSIYEHQRKSVVAWIANKLGSLLHLDSCVGGGMLYSALHTEIVECDKSSEDDYVIYLAHCLLSWLELGSDVYFKIREMDLPDKHHKYLLEIYEEIKDTPNMYFNMKSPDHTEDKGTEGIVWEVYRDVIHASSQRKFLLIKEDEIPTYTKGEVICEEKIVERPDISKVREVAKQSLSVFGLPSSTVMGYLLIISESITNILKHAKDGKLTIIKSDSSVILVVEDTGTGFPLKILPYTILTAGYSTKKSLGQGFTLMMKMADNVYLRTSPKGSTLVIVFNDKGDESSEQ